MEQNRDPRNMWSINIQQRRQKYTMGKGQSLHLIILEKLDSYMQKDETRPFSYTIYKNELKKD